MERDILKKAETPMKSAFSFFGAPEMMNLGSG
jgi:hypothetical protein